MTTTAIVDAVITRPNGWSVVRGLTGNVPPYAVALVGSSWVEAD